MIGDIRANGFVDRSLRDIAAAVGSSHRMLIYHFGSREGLLEAVVTAELTASRAADATLFDRSDGSGIRARWERDQEPDAQALDPLFYELAALAARHTDETKRFRDEYVEPWLELCARAAEAAGDDPAAWRMITRLDVAVLVGLQLDRLLTGDDEVESAFQAYEAMRRLLIARHRGRATDD